MSGIEAIGITLAVFPILVDGLDRVASGIETIKRWKRYKIKLQEYADILKSASVYFFDTLDELLGDIVSSDEELELLLETPGGILWKKPEYEGRLRKRLDRSYSSYLKTISTLVRALRTMGGKLGIDGAGGVKLEDSSMIEHHMKRLKLTISKNTYKELLEDIHRANRELREVTHHNIALEPMKRKRRSRRPITDLKLIRKHAASLYQVLMNDKAWKCKCKMHHLASLRLEARPQTIENVKADSLQRHTFRVLLSVADNTSSTSGTAQWNDIEIIPSAGFLGAVEKSQTSPGPTLEKPQFATRSVRFVPETDTYLTGLANEATPAQSSSKHIEDFCSALCVSNRDDREIGLLVDEANDKQGHMLYRVNTVIESKTSSRSLEDLLTSQRCSGDEGLSRKDRLQIAVVLASSVLQLDGTSWLQRGWSSVDIFFHYKDGQVSEHTYPYLAWQRCCSTDLACSLESLSISNHMIRSDVLLALGLTLVELCFGKTLADMRKPEDVDANQIATRLRTATRLHPRVYDEMGIPYGDVVRRCLFQLFDVRELSLDIEEVQQKVLDDVVAPLVDDLNDFNGYLKIR